MQLIGTKFQIYENDELKVRRLIKAKNINTYVLKEIGTNLNFVVTNEELVSKYITLTPDAFLNIMITQEETLGNNIVNDVYFCVNKASDLTTGMNMPSLILRQNIYSKFKNISTSFTEIYIGDCYTTVNSSKEEFKDFMTFEKILKQYSVATYIDDSEEDILECISSKFKKEINNVLCNIKSSISKSCKGTTESIEQLWEENNFIGNYKSIFNIVQIDFPIVIGKESYNKNGDIVLNSKQKHLLEDMLRRYISNIRIIKYDKDIDISKIVIYQHVVVCDSENIIYLIAYEIDGYYADNDDDRQVLESFGLYH